MCHGLCSFVKMAREPPGSLLASGDAPRAVSDPKLAKSPLLSISDVAARLRISKRSAYRIAGEVAHVKIGRRLLVPELAIERYIEARMTIPTAFEVSPSRGRGTTLVGSTSRRPIEVRTKPRPGIAEWLRPIAPRTRRKP